MNTSTMFSRVENGTKWNCSVIEIERVTQTDRQTDSQTDRNREKRSVEW